MAGRQSQHTRYTSTNQPYSNTSGNNLNIPFPHQNNNQYSTQTNPYGSNSSMTSPYSSSSPSHHSPNISKHTQPQPLKKYVLQAPARKQPLSKTMPSLGYPDFFPQRPGQEEDVLTESNVRYGFMDKHVVSNEHTCAHDIVYGKLQDDQRLLGELGSFMVDVLQRQSRASCISGPSSFKPPTRTTLIDSKREQWMQELAVGLVPLRKLMRNVPHGFKGEKLLETLAAKHVPFLRATWYIKIVGLSEMSQRNSSNAITSMGPQPIQWTMTVTSHLKKQLNELNPSINQHPNNTMAGRSFKSYNNSNHFDNSQKPWISSESRSRFEQRWSYSVRLARWQYYEGLLDQRTFLRWTLDTLAQCTTFEVMWLILTGVIQDYIDEYKRNRTLTKLLIEALIKSYNALIQYNQQLSSEGVSSNVHVGLQRDIEHLLQSLFLSTPDLFVVPKLYHQYRYIFDDIFGGDSKLSLTDNAISSVMKEYWAMIKSRNEVFCGTIEENESKNDTNLLNTNTTVNNSIGSKVSMSIHSDTTSSDEINEERVVHILDIIGCNIDTTTGLLLDNDGWMDIRGHTANTASKAIFGSAPPLTSIIFKIIHILCRWAISESRYGDWKAYLVASIMLSWKDNEGRSENKFILQDGLIKFLDDESISADSQPAAEEADNVNSPIFFLFEILIRLNLFSYQKYLLRLIARGDLEGKRRNDKQIQKCLRYLAAFPVVQSAPNYLVNQRRVALYGTRNERELKAELESTEQLKRLAKRVITGYDLEHIDCLFGTDAKEMTQPVPTDSLESFELAFTDKYMSEFCNIIQSATRYTVIDFTSNWLLNEVKHFIVKSIQIGEDNWRVMTSPGSCLLNCRQFITIVKIMELAKDYLSIIDMSLWVLEKSNDAALYPCVIDTLRKYSNYWKLTNHGAHVVNTVWNKHMSLQSRGNRNRYIMMYMVQLVQEGYQIDEVMRLQLQQDLQVRAKMRDHYKNKMSILDELSKLTKDSTPSSIQLLSESLSNSTQNPTGWIGIILENAGHILHQKAIEAKMDEAAKSTKVMTESLLNFHRILRAYATVIKDVSNNIIFTGQADDAVIQWLTHNNLVAEDMNKKNSWIPLFVTVLVSCNVISLNTVIKEFALPRFEQVGLEGQRLLLGNNGTEESKLVIFCQNLISLVRLLIVQTSNHEESSYSSWQLRIEEYYRLDVQRLSQLSTSLDRIEPMFGLMERLVMIATNLPLSSELLQDIVMLRADLLKIEWFRQACLRDLNGVYQRFAAREAEATMEKKIKKKMLNIVDELIGGNLVGGRQAMIHDNAPDFVDKLHRVFLNVSQWNEAQCRVQINLLLDNISLSDGNSQNSNNPHILGDDISPEIGPSDSTTFINKDLESFVYYFYDVVLADEEREGDSSKAQRRFQFFKNLIHEVREPVLLELLQHGARLLEGDPSQDFPDNILLMPNSETNATFDSDKHAYRNQAFLNVTQHILAENPWSNEKKIEFIKTIFGQICRFKNCIPTYKVMESAGASYSDAAQALQLANNNIDSAIALLLTEGLPENHTDEGTKVKNLYLHDIRTSLLIRLKLVVPFASLIWEHPKEDECDIFDWIRTLIPLLVSPIVHGNGSQERFFEFVLDFVSILLDEVPKELKKACLSLLGTMHNELSSIPAIFHSRVKRIMPFLTHNIYLANTRMASSILGLPPTSDLQQQQIHLESCLEQSKPWEWLEDYVSDPPHDNDAPISLSLFNARKVKRTESTYVRWFKFGFNDGKSSMTKIDKYSNNSNTANDSQQGLQKERVDNSDFIYIKDDENELDKGKTPNKPKRRRVDMEEGELP
ncbi:hypothetical protein BDB01DRAFT_850197 [Pilobolus umbonatus]|nr:hypothetical protein BDB01DRAFT_850197 [Pilobolus umbonatus]